MNTDFCKPDKCCLVFRFLSINFLDSPQCFMMSAVVPLSPEWDNVFTHRLSEGFLMRFFQKKIKKARRNLGVVEAEGESNENSSIRLMDVFHDDLGILEELASQKFIVVGRKGSGKSALASYIFQEVEQSPTAACQIIRHDEIQRELNIQGVDPNRALDLDFYKWLVMVALIELLMKHESAFYELKSFGKLKEFVEVNRGGVRVTEKKIVTEESAKSRERKSELGVDAKPLKAFMKSNDLTSVKQVKNSPTIHEVLPDLEKVIEKLLSSSARSENDNHYYIFFDDLDIGFDAKNDNSVSSIISLLRATKQINHKWNKYNFKCLILLRDDVERLLSSRESDLNKLFSSYSATLNWYKKGESAPDLKDFIERRIAHAFKEAEGIDNALWFHLTEMPFKDVIDKTFCSPRDLIAFFEPLNDKDHDYPLTKSDTLNLARSYGRHVLREFENELSSFYTIDEIKLITKILRTIFKNESKIDEIIPIFEGCNLDYRIVLKDLYDRNFIGMRMENGHVFFKYKSLKGHTYGLEFNVEHDHKLQTHFVFEHIFSEFY